jgi:hypothetical protein
MIYLLMMSNIVACQERETSERVLGKVAVANAGGKTVR